MGAPALSVKGVHFVRKVAAGRPVRWYVYAWRGGPCIKTVVGGPKPRLDEADLKALVDAQEASSSIKPDTMAALVRDWRRSPEWARLAVTTKRTWSVPLDKLEAKWADAPLRLFDNPRIITKIIDWRNEALATPRAADLRMTVLSQLLEWGRLHGRLRGNAAKGIPSLWKGGNRADVLWLDDDIAAFNAVASKPLQDVLALACLTGLRRADLAGLLWTEVSDTHISRLARKKSRGRRRRANIPVYDALRSLLEDLRTRPRFGDVQTVLVTASGAAWNPDSLTQRFGEARDKANDGAGIVQTASEEMDRPAVVKHLHDCRGTFITNLCRAGLTDAEIAGLVAWSPENVASIRRTYVDDTAVVVALGERLKAAGTVNRIVNQRGAGHAK